MLLKTSFKKKKNGKNGKSFECQAGSAAVFVPSCRTAFQGGRYKLLRLLAFANCLAMKLIFSQNWLFTAC